MVLCTSQGTVRFDMLNERQPSLKKRALSLSEGCDTVARFGGKQGCIGRWIFGTLKSTWRLPITDRPRIGEIPSFINGEMKFLPHIAILLASFITADCLGQLVINEGCNKNYSLLSDEDGDFEDWIEIHNAGTSPVDLFEYSLSDDASPGEWTFPHQLIQPGEFMVIFCSGKDRYASSAFTSVLSDSTFQPQSGWNTHQLSVPFQWDGISNIVLNLCTFNPFYTNNSIHSQSPTAYNSSITAVNEPGSACAYSSGGVSRQRPDIRFNASTLGTGTLQNGYFDYPSPYSNWYGSSRQQYLYKASELLAAGLTPGNIDSIAFDVVVPCPTGFASLELGMACTGEEALGSNFIPAAGNRNHTNFKINSTGETIILFDPSGLPVSSLDVACGPGYDVSMGSLPDTSSDIKRFISPTPGATNNTSLAYDDYALAPVFSVNSGIHNTPFSVVISDPNLSGSTIHYTLDGSDPDTTTATWNGIPINISQSTILRARAYATGAIPSTITSASYLLNIRHTTPVVSVISDPDDLFGPTGMFDNPTLDLLKAASIDYFDSTASHNLLFSQRAGIIMDGGWGSRGNPQRPFRIKLDDGVLGDGRVTGTILSDRPTRNEYNEFYLFNGGGNYAALPYKDAAQCRMMGQGVNTYYAASTPVTVYINGEYWGLYDMKEKFNTEMFRIYDGATENTIEIAGSSAQYGFQLRAMEGDVQHFYDSFNSFMQLNPSDTGFWTQADRYFDMVHYNDYIIAEIWMNNVDWGANYNNIKIYRSDATDFSWRYCLMDLEYGLLPNHGSLFGGNFSYNCTFDLLGGLFSHQSIDPGNPHLSVFWRGLQNDRFRNYFINRFADQMNTVYRPSRLIAIENSIFSQTLPEMPAHFTRWHDPNNVPGHMNAYLQYHQLFESELACRPDNMRDHIRNTFNLPRQVDVELDVFPTNAGKINISTISPENYPWNGIYFDGVPIKIEAVALPGYRFSHWESNGLVTDTLDPVFMDTLSTNRADFTAHYSVVTGSLEEPVSGLLIYPNPAHDRLAIKPEANTGKIQRVVVCDIVGKQFELKVLAEGRSTYMADISDLEPGYYVMTGIAENGKGFRGVFVKQ